MTARLRCLAKAMGGLGSALVIGTLIAAHSASAQLPPPPTSPAPAVRYEYDAQGNPRRSIQAPGLSGYNFSTLYTHDGLHRRRSITDARAGLTRLDYSGRDEPWPCGSFRT